MTLGGRGEPGESLVGPVMVVLVPPGIEGGLEVGGAVPVTEPDAFELHGLDDAFGDGVAGGPAYGGKGVVEAPRLAEGEAVAAGVLGPVIGAEFQVGGNGLGGGEGLQKGLPNGFQDRVAFLGTADSGVEAIAVAAIHHGHHGNKAILPGPDGGEVRGPAAVALGNSHVPAPGRFAASTRRREEEVHGLHQGVDALPGGHESLGPEGGPDLENPPGRVVGHHAADGRL